MPRRKPGDYFWRPAEEICPLCHETVLRTDHSVQGIERFILDQHSTLRQCQPGLAHQHCFQTWEHRRLYVRLYNQHQKAIETSDFSLRMKAHGAIGSYDYHHKPPRNRQ